jgi:Lon protease-like protein
MPWLPLFPLNTVLFPHMPLPLYVFEPRYKQMLDDCLTAGQSFGVVGIREGLETGPAIPYEVGTLAKIVSINRLEDGNFNLLVSGASRFEIVSTAQDRPYLRGEVRFLAEEGDDPDETSAITEEAATAFLDYSNLLRRLVDQPSQDFEPPMEAELLSYLIGASLNLQLPEKQALLATGRADDRLKAELRILRKEITLLKRMLEVKTTGAQASLN